MNRIALWAIASSAIGCASVSGVEKRYHATGVVLANSMCAPKGVSAASNDPVGERMMCEMEEVTGSHVSKCVCRAEDEIVAGREASQQYIRDVERGSCLTNGSGVCAK